MKTQTPAQAYDTLAPVYDMIYSSKMARAENAVIFREIRRWLRLRLTDVVLDAGCGTGLLLDQLPEISPLSYFGLDISTGMLDEAARKHPRHCWVDDDMQNLPFICELFSHVTCLFEALNYVEDPLKAVNEFARVLQSGGLLLLLTTTPRPRSRTSYAFGQVEVRYPKSLHALRARDVRALLPPELWNVKLLRGFHCLPERWFPRAPGWFLRAALWLELHTIGRWLPDRCYFQFLVAERRCYEGDKEMIHA